MNALIMNCSPVRNGATAEICFTVADCLANKYDIMMICIDDFKINNCKGCKLCYQTAKCIQQNDGVNKIMEKYEWADIIISVAPSYWADIPGQFKVFIDRCTPWCDTHEPHATLKNGKKGYTIALRTGGNIKECEKVINSIEHFYGHLHISSSDSLALCSIVSKEDVLKRKEEIIDFCKNI